MLYTKLELDFFLEDAIRRLDYNLHMLQNAAKQKVAEKDRSINEVRVFAYTNFLSSAYALQDVITQYLEIVGPKKHSKTIENAIKQHQVMNYIRSSRIAQDHTITPAVTRPIHVKIGRDANGKPIVERDPPKLLPATIKHGKEIVEVPKMSFDKTLVDISLESLAEEAFGFWAHILKGIRDGSGSIPSGWELPQDEKSKYS